MTAMWAIHPQCQQLLLTYPTSEFVSTNLPFLTSVSGISGRGLLPLHSRSSHLLLTPFGFTSFPSIPDPSLSLKGPRNQPHPPPTCQSLTPSIGEQGLLPAVADKGQSLSSPASLLFGKKNKKYYNLGCLGN